MKRTTSIAAVPSTRVATALHMRARRLRQRPSGRLKAGRNRGAQATAFARRAREQPQSDAGGAHGTSERSSSNSTPVCSSAATGARRPGHSTGSGLHNFVIAARQIGRQVADLLAIDQDGDSGQVEPVAGIGRQRRGEFRRQPLDALDIRETGSDGTCVRGSGGIEFGELVIGELVIGESANW